MSLARHPKFLALYEQASADRYLDECWPWPGTRGKGGYGVILLEGTQYRVTRIILGALPDEQVLHTCDNPPCVNPAHLQRGTIQENQYDKGRKGRAARGEENRGGGKLTEADIPRIRARLADPARPTLKAIGAEFGVSASMIANIRDNRMWSHVA